MELFRTITSEAAKRDLGFLVIGGLAVNAYGYSRDTADLDLLISKGKRAEWLSLFAILNYRVVADQNTFLQLSPSGRGNWPVDLMIVNDTTFASMRAEAAPAEMYGVNLLIPSLEHLVALKLHALKHTHVGRFLRIHKIEHAI